jgi:hypothetical protein
MYAFIHDAPATREMYARVLELLGADQPAGLVVHLALALPEGGLRYVDVWESQQACDAFQTRRLGPAVRQVLAEHGIPADEGDGPDGPEHADTLVLDVVDLMLGPDAITAGAATRPS